MAKAVVGPTVTRCSRCGQEVIVFLDRGDRPVVCAQCEEVYFPDGSVGGEAVLDYPIEWPD